MYWHLFPSYSRYKVIRRNEREKGLNHEAIDFIWIDELCMISRFRLYVKVNNDQQLCSCFAWGIFSLLNEQWKFAVIWTENSEEMETDSRGFCGFRRCWFQCYLTCHTTCMTILQLLQNVISSGITFSFCLTVPFLQWLVALITLEEESMYYLMCKACTNLQICNTTNYYRPRFVAAV